MVVDYGKLFAKKNAKKKEAEEETADEEESIKEETTKEKESVEEADKQDSSKQNDGTIEMNNSEIADKKWNVIFNYIHTRTDLAIMKSLEPDECLEALFYNTDIINYISDELKNDRTICYYALGINGLLMRTMNDIIRNDPLACLIAIQCNGEAYKYISEQLQEDRELCIEAVSRNGLMIKYSPFSFRNDPIIARIALDNNGMAMMYMSPAIQCHKGLALVALSNYGYSLQWCSEELRADPDIIATAYTQSPGSVRFAMGAVPAPITPQPSLSEKEASLLVKEPNVLDKKHKLRNKTINNPPENIVKQIKTNYNNYRKGLNCIIDELEESPIIING